MKIIFSEHKSNYENYIFSYAIWCISEDNDTSSTIFSRGFLPGTHDLSHYYLCRSVRVETKRFSLSSENRRISRKCDTITLSLIDRRDFVFTDSWKEFCLHYTDNKFGKDVMTNERLDSIFNSRLVTHVLLFSDKETGSPVGIVTIFLENNNLAFYHFSFYDLNYKNLGIFMMTSAIELFTKSGVPHIYLGTCYSQASLYKTQFSGVEFFNGFCWSNNLEELKYLINRDNSNVTQHLLESDEYRDTFYPHDLEKLASHVNFLETSAGAGLNT